MVYHSDDVMAFEIKGQDELLSLLSKINAELHRLNAILSAQAHETPKAKEEITEKEAKPSKPKNEQKFGRGKDKERLDKLDILKRYRKGESMASIGRSYGCSTQAIWKIIHAESL